MNSPFLLLGMSYSVLQVPSVLLPSLPEQRLEVPQDEIMLTLMSSTVSLIQERWPDAGDSSRF